MASIFLSYAREDLSKAKAVAHALEERGWSVFWDKRIPAGATFADYIEKQLREASAVLVLWSRDAAASEWVRNEAAHGFDRKPSALVPAIIEPCEIPFEFRRIQAVNLSEWAPGGQSEEFDALVAALARVTPPDGPPPVLPPDPSSGSRWPLAALIVAVAFVAGVGVWNSAQTESRDSLQVSNLQEVTSTKPLEQGDGGPKQQETPPSPSPVKRAFCTQNEINAQKVVGAFDLGYPGFCPRYVHVDGDEFCDYCRVVGNYGNFILSCTLGTAEGLVGATLQANGIDAGWANECEWVDLGDGTPAFTRVVGNNHEQVAITPVRASGIGGTSHRPK